MELYKQLKAHEKIKVLRVAQNLTQTQLAEICGTSQKNIWLWETGKTKPINIYKQKLKEVLGEDVFKED